MADSLSLLIKSAFDATGITAATRSINSMDGQISRVTKSFSRLMGLFAGGAAGAAIYNLGKSMVISYAESEKAVSLLTVAYKNLGNFTQKDIQEQISFASELQKTTKYTDEQVMAVQTQLITYGLYGEKLKAATVATLDLAVKTGSTETASKLMGKAFQGQTDTLARYGLKIDENIKGGAKFDAVLKLVQDRMGGMAAAEGETLLGQIARMNNAFDDLKENIGGLIAPWVISGLGNIKTAIEAITGLFASPADKIKKQILEIKEQTALLNKELQAYQNAPAKSDAFEIGGGSRPSARGESTPEQNIKRITAALAKAKAESDQLKINLQLYEPTSGASGKPTLAGPNLDSAEEIKAQKLQQAEAIKNDKEYARESEKISEQIADIEGLSLTERGQMYNRYFGKIDMARRRDRALQGSSSKQLEINNKQMLLEMERDYIAGSKTISGGWKQAMDEMGQAGLNWKQGFDQVVSSSMGPATESFKTFFNMSKKGFGDMGKLAEGVFKGIRDAFFEMLMQMAARAAVMGFLKIIGIALAPSAAPVIASMSTGGPIPGREGAPVPILAHGGEFMLSANVVNAIKAGRPTSGLGGEGLVAAGGGGASISYSPTININGGVNGGNVREICRQIADAGRKGMTDALDLSKVMYKQGAKRSGETAL